MSIIAGIAALPLLLVYICLLGLGVYFFILMIKLVQRAITALDIYIDKNRR